MATLINGDDRADVTVESHCKFSDRTYNFPSNVDYQAILYTGQESVSYSLFVMLCDSDRANDIRPEWIIQIHHYLVGWLSHLPLLNCTVGECREELRVGFGLDPERLVRLFLSRIVEEETGVTEITIWQRNGRLFGNILSRQKLQPHLQNV